MMGIRDIDTFVLSKRYYLEAMRSSIADGYTCLHSDTALLASWIRVYRGHSLLSNGAAFLRNVASWVEWRKSMN
ncbi:hypothetical protein AGABI1DRAFT_113429 [Agaricus bisporus var. burnettii JB137-S8]|uniref:Uncharacterized protein n=1 Tax=Agaricus bisporus var. burnettii (strain JB137-S8 / ATCC MYA-4627 / FGSC 10392) TaxID=597362 RepID=K5XAG2_AGABU|nr:uncharacterized protein AGABI1DRAFT_113429 [Agaricus bisporus var. burnettii JB137-S8]EKM80228.1 hypothetical protein AGABI1DRAFT_113429 [Agaricus bisporus var. burnettii JB137-S8]